MPVLRQRFGQPFPPHGLHGDAIRQAVTLVGTLDVDFEANQKRSPALRDAANSGVGENTLNAGGRLLPERRGRCSKKVRYSARTSSVVTIDAAARSLVMVKARWCEAVVSFQLSVLSKGPSGS